MDQFLALTQVLLELVTEPADVGDRVGLVIALACEQAPQAVRGLRRTLAEDQRAVDHPDIEPIPRLNPQALARLTWNRDLVLGTDLGA
jgi:hypothetical protein